MSHAIPAISAITAEDPDVSEILAAVSNIFTRMYNGLTTICKFTLDYGQAKN